MSFKNKTVLITGSSRGIGRATAYEFARNGANVVINYVNSGEKAKEIKEKIESMGRKSISIQADVSNPKDIKKMINRVIDEFGRLDVLINNAGIIKAAPLEELNKKDMMRVFEVNLIGCILCSKEAAPYLKKIEGSIVNTASDFGICPSPGAIDYGASKAGIIHVTKSLAKYLAPKIRVNAVAPGLTKTDMTAESSEEHKKESIKATPLNRLDEPENVAKMIVFLASKDASYTTGEIIVCDGGYFLK